jgi:predicted small lipoprotein YifL
MHCWARYLFIILVVVLGTISMIGACGRKGPLYLPQETPRKTPETQSEVPEVPPAPQPDRAE